jgi:hypothetical protein
MKKIELDWATAEVTEGTLSVGLSAKPSRDWEDVFDRTARLLNQGTWEKVKLKKDGVRIAPVVPGEEERVRHFLESVVLEANAAAADDDSGGDARAASDEAGEDAASDEGDREMTDRFRAFAEAGEAGEASEA